MMLKIQTLLAMILIIFLFIGCSSTGGVRMDRSSTQKFFDVQIVSVLPFSCSDPLIAQDVRNIIIEALLGNYSVVTGEEADVVISGTITLSNDHDLSKGSEAISPGPSRNNISEIKAHISKNKRIVDSVTVTKSEADLSSTYSPEALGRKAGIKIREMLSR